MVSFRSLTSLLFLFLACSSAFGGDPLLAGAGHMVPFRATELRGETLARWSLSLDMRQYDDGQCVVEFGNFESFKSLSVDDGLAMPAVPTLREVSATSSELVLAMGGPQLVVPATPASSSFVTINSVHDSRQSLPRAEHPTLMPMTYQHRLEASGAFGR